MLSLMIREYKTSYLGRPVTVTFRANLKTLDELEATQTESGVISFGEELRRGHTSTIMRESLTNSEASFDYQQLIDAFPDADWDTLYLETYAECRPNYGEGVTPITRDEIEADQQRRGL